jgi:hypothetical protein
MVGMAPAIEKNPPKIAKAVTIEIVRIIWVKRSVITVR